MRIFIAIEISDEIKDVLARVESHLKMTGADVKWVNPQNIHLTLKFLGEITDDKCEEVKSALESVAKSAKQFDLSIKDIGTFPEKRQPRVIWVGLDKSASESAVLAAKVDDSLVKIGFPKEERPFSPHLTIGRVKSPKNIGKIMNKIPLASSIVQSSNIPSHKVASIVLFQSDLTPHGPIYTKLQEFGLSLQLIK